MTDSNDTPAGGAEDTNGQSAPADGHLLTFHAHQLRASAIAEDVARERGYRSISRPTPGDQRPRDELRRLGIPAWARDEDARFPGLLIPLYRATGDQISVQYRPDNPTKDPKTGKIRKYAAPAGRASVIDVHPRHRNAIVDPSVPLWVTEGVKKADALTSVDYCAVALSGVWNWRSNLGTLGDWEDVQLKGRWVIICYDSDARQNPQIVRAMARLGKWLKSKGAAKVSYVIPPGIEGVVYKGVDDFLAHGGTVDWLWRGGASDVPPAADQGADLVDPEGWMVDQLAEDVLDGSWLWCPSLGWLRYDDHDGRWAVLNDKGVMVQDEVRRWLKGKYAAAAEVAADAARRGAPMDEIRALEHTASAWRGVCNAARIANLAALARGLVIRDVSDFDTHRDLVNCPNGVLDLRTLTLADHDPALLFTQVTRARYVPGATHPDWAKALEAIPADVRDYVQLRYGQSVTGHPPPDNVVFVQLGKGSNGKTTIVFACQGALGKGYFQLISDRAVIADKSQHPTELMDFRGARMAVLEELPEDRLLNMRRIKQITGPEITARYTRQDSAPYDTTHGLTISTNYDPVVAETDYGSWRRLMALRFPFKYWEPGDPDTPDPPGETDRVAEPGLRERLRDPEPALAGAVLSWLADGAKRWYADGFGARPERIRADTRAWQKASNPVFAWAADNVTGDKESHVWSAEITAILRAHLEAGGHRNWSDSVIGARFAGCCEALGWKTEKREVRERSKLGTLSRPESQWMAAPSKRYAAWTGIQFRTAQDDAESADPGNPGTGMQTADLGVPGVPGVAGNSCTREPTEKSPDTPGTPGTRSSSPLDWAALWAMADHYVDTSRWTDEQWAAHERDTAA